ncbi:glycine betaine/carnitine/choline transport ATP-binding protein OpuCA [Ktedonobacteria bacterium brp13]|nr:glycine betaine/carnitine/choline transport ATP-binding protein OpuCA [Ktedonobacteria bacterium brp13]
MSVKFENVTKMYPGGRPAVKDLSLEVCSGELMVLIGPSGCGKTTTLRMINRLEEPTSGIISIDGRDIHSYDPIQLRRGIGYTIQQTGLLPHMTVEQNIELVPRLLKWDKQKRHERTRELLEMVGMTYETFAHRYPRQLSGGQQQRVGVLRALATDPPVILMDEPFGALDPISREVLQTELKRLQKMLQKTIIFVTHDIDEAMRLGDRVAIMRDGQLLQLSTPDELLHSPKDEFVAKFIRRLFVQQKTALESVRQLMLVGMLQVRQELPGSHRVVQIADAPLWCCIDEDGVLHGSTRALPADSTPGAETVWSDPAETAVKETDAPHDVLRRLTDEGVEAIPVIDADRHLVGIITHQSVIKSLSSMVAGGGV